MRTVTVSHNWYSFLRCLGIAVPTVFGVPSDVSCQDQGRVCQAWSGLVGMKVQPGHSLTASNCEARLWVWASCEWWDVWGLWVKHVLHVLQLEVGDGQEEVLGVEGEIEAVRCPMSMQCSTGGTESDKTHSHGSWPGKNH